MSIKLIFESDPVAWDGTPRKVKRVIRQRESIRFTTKLMGDHDALVIVDERNREVASAYEPGAGWATGKWVLDNLRIEATP